MQELAGVEVVGCAEALDLVELLEEPPCAHPHRPVILFPVGHELFRTDVALGSAQQQVAQLPGEAHVRQRRHHVFRPIAVSIQGRAPQDLPDLHVMFRAGHQPRGRLSPLQLDGAVKREGPGVHGTHQRARRGIVTFGGEPGEDPVAQVSRGLLGGSEEHDFLSCSPSTHELHRRFNQQGGLPRPRAAQHRVRMLMVQPLVPCYQGPSQAIKARLCPRVTRARATAGYEGDNWLRGATHAAVQAAEV